MIAVVTVVVGSRGGGACQTQWRSKAIRSGRYCSVNTVKALSSITARHTAGCARTIAFEVIIAQSVVFRKSPNNFTTVTASSRHCFVCARPDTTYPVAVVLVSQPAHQPLREICPDFVDVAATAIRRHDVAR